MISEIVKRLEAKPFEPFDIVTTAGKSYRVASADHAHLTPRKTRVVVMFDDESTVTITALHIAAVEVPQIAA